MAVFIPPPGLYPSNWREMNAAPEMSLAQWIMWHPVPKNWEPRRTKDSDAYFINMSSGKPTSSLWWDPVPTALRSPLPAALSIGCTQSIINGKLKFTTDGHVSEERPPPDEKSSFLGVLLYKEYCQIEDFFPQNLIIQYQEDAKPQSFQKLSLPTTTLPRYMRNKIH
jgi:hypothetical protein